MLNNRTSQKSERRATESGQAAVFLVLAMGLFLIGSMGFVVDGANLWFHRQSAQTAADAACTAGAMNMLSVAAGANPPTPNWIGAASFECSGSGSGGGNTPNSGLVPCQYAALNGYTSSGLQANKTGTEVSVSFPGSFASIPSCSAGIALCSAEAIANTPYLQVNIADRVQTTFIGMLSGGRTVDVGAQATCGLSNVLSPVPVVVLNPSQPQTLTGSGNLSVTNSGQKGIQVNSIDSGTVSFSGRVNLTNSKGGQADFSVAAREDETDSGVTLTGNWVSPAGIISDPFASTAPPAKPANVGSVDTRTSNCPGIPGGITCDLYHPGYWPGGIPVRSHQNGSGPTGLAVFEPGVYYLDGDFSAGSNTCLRPSGDTASGGTIFYFHTGTVQISANSGQLTRRGGAFDCQSISNAVPASLLACPSSGQSNFPSLGIAGNVLLGPCEGTYTDINGNQQIMGDPLGTNDPMGEQRGMLFFQGRDTSVVSSWKSASSFGLIGNIYIHHCGAGSESGANCSSSAFDDTFSLDSGSTGYIVGDLVVDQLTIDSGANISVSLNPNPQYYTLKASLLQ